MWKLTRFLQPLLVQDDGVFKGSSKGRLRDVVGAVVLEDLPVFPVYVSLWQSPQAVQELVVEHQTVGLQHILGQLQLGFGPHEAVGLQGDAEERCESTAGLMTGDHRRSDGEPHLA